MKKIVIAGVVVAGILVLVVGYYLLSPLFIVIEVNENFPVSNSGGEVLTEEEMMQMIIYQGDFTPSAHEVEGIAKVIEENGEKTLRFENFETINGPNLHIYLASDLDVNDYVDLGEIKATKGNVNYEIPENTDLEKYNKVVVWCVPFKVLFSYAELE